MNTRKQLGAKEKPTFPQNLLADFAAGGFLCAIGILLALHERSTSGKGQVVDSAMVDGTNYLSAFFGHTRGLLFGQKRGEGVLGGEAPFYDTYETCDGKFVAVGSIEPQFYAILVDRLGLHLESLPPQMDASSWPEMKRKFAQIFKSKSRKHWEEVFDGTDACVTPVLEPEEMLTHAHPKERKLMEIVQGKVEVSPAPLLSRTPATRGEGYPLPGQHTVEVLREYGLEDKKIRQLMDEGVVKSLHSKL